ncbi:MAG: alpha/beta fold hydrolase [Candidatus Rokubacteria bacterium]|nr:alpha/beta fold hydrolase [Candidatus Rokubacteria bacterium]
MRRDQALVLHGSRFHYTECGDAAAPALVMLHGITGHARTWDEEAAALAGRYRVLALDQRGHGDSDPPPDTDYTIAALTGDLAAFVDALGLRSFSLVALSMGGRVAIQYAGTHPGRVERLVIVDIGPDIAAGGRMRVGRMMAATPERFRDVDEVLAYQRANNPRYTEALLRARVHHGVRALPDGGYTWKYDRGLRELVRSGTWSDPIDLWPPWRALTCPTLLVRGAESDILTAEIAKAMLAAQPHAELAEVAGAGHTVPGDQPEAFVALLRRFLRA